MKEKIKRRIPLLGVIVGVVLLICGFGVIACYAESSHRAAIVCLFIAIFGGLMLAASYAIMVIAGYPEPAGIFFFIIALLAAAIIFFLVSKEFPELAVGGLITFPSFTFICAGANSISVSRSNKKSQLNHTGQ